MYDVAGGGEVLLGLNRTELLSFLFWKFTDRGGTVLQSVTGWPHAFRDSGGGFIVV